jgi:hypothetical protein
MAWGDIDQARIAEGRAKKLLKGLDTLVEARGLTLPDAFQVSAAECLEPRSTRSEEELEATFAYAWEHAELTPPDVVMIIINAVNPKNYDGDLVVPF